MLLYAMARPEWFQRRDRRVRVPVGIGVAADQPRQPGEPALINAKPACVTRGLSQCNGALACFERLGRPGRQGALVGQPLQQSSAVGERERIAVPQRRPQMLGRLAVGAEPAGQLGRPRGMQHDGATLAAGDGVLGEPAVVLAACRGQPDQYPSV